MANICSDISWSSSLTRQVWNKSSNCVNTDSDNSMLMKGHQKRENWRSNNTNLIHHPTVHILMNPFLSLFITMYFVIPPKGKPILILMHHIQGIVDGMYLTCEMCKRLSAYSLSFPTKACGIPWIMILSVTQRSRMTGLHRPTASSRAEIRDKR